MHFPVGRGKRQPSQQPNRRSGEGLFPGGNKSLRLGMRPGDTGTMRTLLIHKMSVNKLLDMDNADITKVFAK